MCFNFNLDAAGKQIVNHLVNMNPLVYDHVISDRLYQLIPELRRLTRSGRGRRRRIADKTQLAQKIKTRAGQELSIYSKSADFNHDLYDAWVDSALNSSLYVQTWRRGAGEPLNSTCPRDNYKVNNVLNMKVLDDSKRVTWNYLQDHSKWAISDLSEDELVCISDVNRMHSQFKRGGGAVCIKCKTCWTVFSSAISDIEPCPVSRINRIY